MQKTNFDFEVLIHDDASSDGTAQILKDYENRYPKIFKIIYQSENQYSRGVRAIHKNFNFNRAKGKYLAICEGDDYWKDPFKLQKQVDFLEENLDYIITFGKVQPFDKNGLISKVFGNERDLSRTELIKCPAINTSTVCFRNTVSNFPKEMNYAGIGDLFLWSILGNYGKGKFLDNIEPTMYRIHDDGIFSTKTPKQKNEMWLRTCLSLFTYYIKNLRLKFAFYFFFKSIQSCIFKITYKA